MVSEEIDFTDSPSVYKKFDGDSKPLSILLRYEIKTDPKIDFEKVELDPEPNVGKVKVGIIGAGNFASTTILPILKELRRDCQVLGIASSGGLSLSLIHISEPTRPY